MFFSVTLDSLITSNESLHPKQSSLSYVKLEGPIDFSESVHLDGSLSHVMLDSPIHFSKLVCSDSPRSHIYCCIVQFIHSDGSLIV